MSATRDLADARRRADMLVSMHASMRDRLASLATLIDLLILGSSILLAGAVFIDPLILRELFGSTLAGRLVTGSLSLTILFLSVAALIVRWKERAAQHDHAARQYSQLVQAGRLLEEDDVTSQAAWVVEYNEISESLVHIPQRFFNRLKQRHERKVALSKAISASPYASPLVLRARLWLSGNIEAVRGNDSNSSGPATQ